jgi:hypothetical protein
VRLEHPTVDFLEEVVGGQLAVQAGREQG